MDGLFRTVFFTSLITRVLSQGIHRLASLLVVSTPCVQYMDISLIFLFRNVRHYVQVFVVINRNSGDNVCGHFYRDHTHTLLSLAKIWSDDDPWFYTAHTTALTPIHLRARTQCEDAQHRTKIGVGSTTIEGMQQCIKMHSWTIAACEPNMFNNPSGKNYA